MAPSSADPPHEGAKPGSTASRFLRGLANFQSVVLVSHIQPDPDSMGSMLGLAHLIETKLHLPTKITRDGFIGRAENRAMVECLDIELVPIEDIDWSAGEALVMVDSQPNTGRHTFPVDLPIYAVLDHHETMGDLEDVQFRDIRAELGATCTIVTNYLRDEQIDIPARIATGLYYGIESELTGYPREASALDDASLLFLYPHAQKDLLAYIRNARLPHSYFETLLQALQNSFIYDKLVISWAADLPQPELTAEIADFLIRFEEVEWAFCAGIHQDNLVLSVRTIHHDGRAGTLLQQVVGRLGTAGGHDRRAGGLIPLESTAPSAVEQLRGQLRRRLLSALRIDECRGQRLVSRKELLSSLQA
jgi:nanoRNase/pAp phosphatase (c-di-AMP/oligoRNAs hydrolase)